MYFCGQMNKSFSTISVFILLALMFFKVSPIHALTHEESTDENMEHCEICEFAIENQNPEYLVPASSQTIPAPIFVNTSEKQTVAFRSIVPSSFLRSNFFGRPPPKSI
jgi:hypothetical protein